MRLAVKRLVPGAVIPERAYDGDAGLDLHAVASATLGPGQRAAIGTGIAVEIPERHAGLVLPRSGLAMKHGIALVNAPGLVDEGYRGEIRVLLLNSDREQFFDVEAGMRIAQLLIVRVEAPDVVEVGELESSHRGEDGFGSSGR